MVESLSQKPIPVCGIAFSPKWWAKVAMQVALDPAVSDKAYRVFTVIAAYGKGNTANVGQRRLAELLGKTQSYISKRVKELREAGWLGTKDVCKGKRTVYVLLSTAYEGEPSSESIAPSPSVPQSGVQCSHCHRERKAISAAGICRKCLREMEEERLLKEARKELGPDASVEQLALRCHIKRLTPRTRKILRRIERAA